MDSTSGVRREAAEDVAPGGGGMDGVGGGGVGMGAGNCSIAGASGAEFLMLLVWIQVLRLGG